MTPLSDILNCPNGIIHTRKGKLQTVIIEKADAILRLKLLSPLSTEWQALIDLRNPTALICPFMRVMALSLAWNSEPKRVHMVGLGGGCLPTFLRRNFPDLIIDCTEIDVEIFNAAVEFFGFRTDSRLKVFIQDGRAFLTSRPVQDPYDIIFVDAFMGVGFSPLSLGSREFLLICRSQMGQTGVLVVNLLPGDPIITVRITTIASVFRYVWVSEAEEALVVFATDAVALQVQDLIERADVVQGRHHFSFSMSAMAKSTLQLPHVNIVEQEPQHAALLTDNTPSTTLRLPKALLASIARNDQCPCGSGKKFKKCHALVAALNDPPTSLEELSQSILGSRTPIGSQLSHGGSMPDVLFPPSSAPLP